MKDRLESLVKEYLHLKKLGKSSVISVVEGKARRKAILKEMAKLVGYNL